MNLPRDLLARLGCGGGDRYPTQGRRGASDDESGLGRDKKLRVKLPIWPGPTEASRFNVEIARRADEVVLVTRTAAESAALRDWGAFAIARTVARIGVPTPQGCGGEMSTRDLVAYVAGERAGGVGPEGLVALALGRKAGRRARSTRSILDGSEHDSQNTQNTQNLESG